MRYTSAWNLYLAIVPRAAFIPIKGRKGYRAELCEPREKNPPPSQEATDRLSISCQAELQSDEKGENMALASTIASLIQGMIQR